MDDDSSSEQDNPESETKDMRIKGLPKNNISIRYGLKGITQLDLMPESKAPLRGLRILVTNRTIQ